MPQNPKTFLSTKEVAELLDVNEKVVYSLISEKGLPACKITGKWIFPRYMVEKWIENNVINYPRESQPGSETVLVIAGSNDPLMERTIALYNNIYHDVLAVFGSTGSLGGLKALNRKQCHIATSHLMHGDEEEYNFAYLEEQMDGPLPAVVNFCFREQGIIVARGNPREINQISSLSKPGIRIANRQKGTGTRLLLEHELKKAGVNPLRINGFDTEFPTHLAVGLEVLAGRADAAVGIRAIAALLNLEFIPLKKERYDLLIPRDRFFDKAIQRFLGLLQDKMFKELASTFEGYDLAMSGKMVFPGN